MRVGNTEAPFSLKVTINRYIMQPTFLPAQVTSSQSVFHFMIPFNLYNFLWKLKMYAFSEESTAHKTRERKQFQNKEIVVTSSLPGRPNKPPCLEWRLGINVGIRTWSSGSATLV